MPISTIIRNLIRQISINVRMNISVIALVIHVVVTLYGRPFLNFRYPSGNYKIE
ncbi:hypothetical protein HanXRQr2_Chr09g0385141 [Helianthus annuus]|uniref:Uncharacterized protein n=1 Tax=Helianthus annuus TaxID=4232 RepID=A0A251TXU9_HELAN|nr:hypothetical protein HanXRQr2_Chr09g0385141 [Helianthus annuus]